LAGLYILEGSSILFSGLRIIFANYFKLTFFFFFFIYGCELEKINSPLIFAALILVKIVISKKGFKGMKVSDFLNEKLDLSFWKMKFENF